jgi:heterodisulfide reductase subunit D
MEQEVTESAFAKLVTEIRELQQLLLDTDDVPGVQRYVKPHSTAGVVLNLGCNILRTPHLAVEAIIGFEALGEEFVPVAGPQFCCGILQHRDGDETGATRLLGSTISRSLAYGARLMAVWCPTCLRRFQDAAAAGSIPALPFVSSHSYLAERATKLEFSNTIRRRVALHDHVGTAPQEADGAAVLRLLHALPGVEVVGSIGSHDLSDQCSPALRARLGEAAFLERRHHLLEAARDKGADTVVTIYHSCQRHWCDAEGIQIRSYVSLLAEALGRSHVDAYQVFKRLGDPDAIVSQARALGVARGLSGSQVRLLGEKFFVKGSRA